MDIYKSLLLITLLLLVSSSSHAQFYEDEWEEHDVDQIYIKKDVDYGTLDEDGDSIDHIYIPAELDRGKYEVEISDETGDLYLIEGSDYYLTFDGYYGYASYDEGYLVVEQYGATFYTKE